MVLCMIVGCGSKSGRDKGLYFARVPSVVTNQGEEAQGNIRILGHTVKPLLSGHLRDLPKCPLNSGCPLNRGCKNFAMFVNDQHSTVTLY